MRWFGGTCGGTYLEMGALDGITYSNSHVFHKARQWKGVLIEASPPNYEKLVKNRPDEIATIHAAVCNKARDVHWVRGKMATGGILEFASEHFKKNWWDEEAIKNAELVRCMPLHDILDSIGHSQLYFDFFSLDVEVRQARWLKRLKLATRSLL